jgi:hypothetical protein
MIEAGAEVGATTGNCTKNDCQDFLNPSFQKRGLMLRKDLLKH